MARKTTCLVGLESLEETNISIEHHAKPLKTAEIHENLEVLTLKTAS